MNFILNEIYHVYNRGNNQQPIFLKEENYLLFIEKMRVQLKPCCDILCWCLMPNHFHFILHANEMSLKERTGFGGKGITELSYRIGILLSSYSQLINKQQNTTGSLFQQKTKAKELISNYSKNKNKAGNYLINVMHYCHQNPMRAGLVKKMEDWPYSSFSDYAGLRNGTLCNKSLLMELTGYDLKNFYEDTYNIIEDFDGLDIF